MSAGRIFVLGNAGVDLSLTLPRLPAPGETLVALAASTAPGGKGLNQAVVAARAGAAVLFGAPVGDDDDGRAVARMLAGEPLAALELWRLPQRTDQSILMVAGAGAQFGENCIVTAGACADALATDAAAAFGARLQPGDLLLVQGNLSMAATRAACESAAARGGRVMLNAAPVRWPAAGLLTFCDIVVVNESEAAGLTGASGEAAAAMLHAAGARRAVVTLGAAGCAVADDVGTITVAGVAAEAVDSTGAGDTLCGCLAARLAAGAPWSVALATAQRAAAITVTRPGAFAALPSASEMRGLIDAEPDAGRQAAPPAP